MNRHERGLEFKVGVFVFAGLAMLGALVVQFGRLGEGFKTYYALTIRFCSRARASAKFRTVRVWSVKATVLPFRSRFMIT